MNTNLPRTRIAGAAIAGLTLVGALTLTAGASANAASAPTKAPASSTQTTTTQVSPTPDKETRDGNDTAGLKGSITAPEAGGEGSSQAEQTALQPLAKISVAQAKAAAVAGRGGAVARSAILQDADGYVTYGVMVKDAKGTLTEVTVDAGNSRVLAVEAAHEEGQADSGKTSQSPALDLETNDSGVSRSGTGAG